MRALLLGLAKSIYYTMALCTKNLFVNFTLPQQGISKEKNYMSKKNIPSTTKSLFVLVHQYLFNNLLHNLK